jgi:N4-gp56 family major capsid protein
MSTTMPSDFAFTPKVWEDAVSAYFQKKLVFGAMAAHNDSLTQKPGTSINFPYFKSISAAEEPAADETLSVDKLQDDAFSATVKEVGKAVGVRRAALMSSSQDQDRIFAEVQSQIGRVMAEKVDADLITEVNTSGSYVQGFTSTDTQYCNIARIMEGLITGFGDKQDECVALYMHSLNYLALMTDSTAGFLKADANDPFWNQPGFMGRLLGKALFVSDQCPRATDVSSKKTYQLFAMKMNPYGIITKANPIMESDYDMLNREYVFAGTQWYAVKSFHAKIATADYRVCRMSFQTTVTA